MFSLQNISQEDIIFKKKQLHIFFQKQSFIDIFQNQPHVL